MKAKIAMVAGMGLGKVAPLLFGLYLSREFGAASFAGFVLVLTYVTALAALPSLGATPQIIRAGVHDNPEAAVVRAILASLVLLLGVVGLSLAWWLLLADHALAAPGLSPLRVQGWVALFAAGLVLYALAQSTCSLQARHFAVGGYSALIYLAAAGAGMLAGRLGGEGAALDAYFLVFLLAAAGFFLASQWPLRPAWRRAARGLHGSDLLAAVRGACTTSLFGLLTLAGLYLLMHATQLRLAPDDRAVFALGFQLFQAGIFLPSVFGAIVVPRLVAAGRGAPDEAAALHRRTQGLYLGIGLAWLLAVLVVARPLLALYGLPAAGWSGLVLLQVAAVLAGLQAYFIQRLVAQGHFGRLARAALLWAGSGYATLWLLPPGLLSAAAALVLAYVLCLGFYLLTDSGRSDK